MNQQPQIQATYTILNHQGFADVMINNLTGEKSLHSLQQFKKDAIVCEFSTGVTSSIPTYLTVQIGIEKHITLSPEFLQYCNHSCNPNVFFDTTNYELIALKNIEIGEELTFFYPSSEWDMTQSFACTCNNKNCLHNIKGAKYLAKEILPNYRFTDFINSMLK